MVGEHGSLGHLSHDDIPDVHVRPPARLPVDTDILAPIDLSSIRDGAFDDESEGGEPLVINTPVNPDKPVFNLAFVSTLGNNEAEVTVRNVFNKEVTKTMKSQDLFMLERQRYAGMKMTETPTKREGTFGNKALTFIERTWKTTIGKRLHEVKEARVGANLMIAAGVDTAITAEFDAVIDQKARENIANLRDNWFKRLTGNIRDVGNEIIGREKDLHREKIKLTTDLRNEYLQDPSNSKHPYAELLNRDMVAREAVAEKFATTPVDFLGEHGDKAREVALAPDSPVAKFLQEQIFKKVIADAISQSDAGTYDGKNGGISAKLRPELDKTLKDYFFSDEFTTWRNGLSPEEQKVFENSLTYTNNVLSQAENVLMPMVHDHLTYFKTNQDIDFDIKLKLGTGQFGPNNEVVGTSIFSKERISKNASAYEKLRQQINGDQSKLYSQGDVSKGLKQAMMMAALNAVVSNEVVAAAVGGTIGGAAKMLLRSSVSWLPILGSGLVAGGVAGAKEYSNLGTMRERFGEQVAEGYTHPVGVNAVRAEALRKVDYHRVDLGIRSEQLLHVAKQIKGGDKSEETILQTLGYLADSKARVALSDKRHINLFHASTDTATGRGIYQKQEALHTQARVLATTKLHELLNSDDALRTQIATKIGFIPTLTSEQILDGLSAFQGEFLEHGTAVDINIQSALKAVTSADVKSIVGQDKAFQSWRWKEVGKRAATTAVIAGATAGLMKLGINEYNVLHEEVIKNVEHKVHTIIDQSVTSHASPLSIGEVQDPNTHEILATMSAHIPKGTTLMADQHTAGAYDLVLSSDPHRVLVDNMTFTDGHLNMTTAVRESLDHSHIAYHSVNTGEVDIAGSDSGYIGTETVRVGDLAGAHEGGFDQWFANNLNHSYRVNPEPAVAGQMVVERTTQINGLREMLYAWEDHEKFLGHVNNFRLEPEPGYHQVMHIDDATGRYLSEPQANGFYIDNLPTILSTEEGHRKIADFINESVQMKLSGANMDPAHLIAYRMSYDGTPGTIPKPEEFEILMEALTKSSTETVAKTVATHDAWFTMTDDLVDIQTVTTTEVINHTIPTWTENAANLAFSTSVPLEAPIYGSFTVEPKQKMPPLGMYPESGNIVTLQNWLEANPGAHHQYKKMIVGGVEKWTDEKGRPVLRDVNREKEAIDNYLDSIKDNDSDHYSRLTNLLAQPTMKPMNTKTRVSVNIPARMEGKGIYKMLESYTAQVDKTGAEINPELYEINIVVNRKQGEASDNTAEEISRFIAESQSKGKQYNINFVDIEFDVAHANVGYARKVITDLTLLRSNSRSSKDGVLYIESEDADLLHVDSRTIINIIEKLDNNPHLDAVRGIEDRAPSVMMENDFLFTMQRMKDFAGTIMQNRKSFRPENNAKWDYFWNRVITGGWNTAYSAEAYALIGGYDAKIVAEDTAIGEKISMIRGDGKMPNLDVIGRVSSRTDSSPRRFIHEVLTGENAYSGAFNDPEVNNLIKNEPLDKLIERIKPLSRIDDTNVDKFKDMLQNYYQYFIKNVTPNEDAAKSLYKLTLGLLGFKPEDYTFEADGSMKIITIDNLKKSLDDYRAKHAVYEPPVPPTTPTTP